MTTNRPIGYSLCSALTAVFMTVCVPMFAGSAPVAKHTSKHKTAHSRNGVSTFADSTEGDDASFDDPIVRQAAIRGLGRYNGSVVAIDPSTGRILSIVNQKLAFSAGFIPCSTIKPVIAVAALQEGFVTRDTMIGVVPAMIEVGRTTE